MPRSYRVVGACGLSMSSLPTSYQSKYSIILQNIVSGKSANDLVVVIFELMPVFHQPCSQPSPNFFLSQNFSFKIGTVPVVAKRAGFQECGNEFIIQFQKFCEYLQELLMASMQVYYLVVPQVVLLVVDYRQRFTRTAAMRSASATKYTSKWGVEITG